MTNATRSTIRYAAKQAYQLALMTGRYGSTHCGLQCQVEPAAHIVAVYEYDENGDPVAGYEVPIAKSWAQLL